jgi:hypothetical protein
MHQSLSRYKLTFQASRIIAKGERSMTQKEDLCLYCGRENHQTRACPIKALASKLHKVRNVSMSSQSKVEDAESKNKDVQPQ